MTTRLLTLPHAGAGAGTYRPWQRFATADLTLHPVQLPGREDEFNSPRYATFADAAAGTAERVRAAAGTDPYVLFGHSFGAVLAYETVHHLRATGGPLPRHLVLSGSVSPRHRGPQWISDDDEQAVADLKRGSDGGLEALDHPQLRALLLPTIRADIRLLSDYRPSTLEPLPIPMTVLRGTDDATVPPDEWLAWAEFTTEKFDPVELPGGHMYLTARAAEVWRIIEGVL
ncbi:alpha/beta fold hydrolase [Streptomyces sp. NPDC001941]|uniref:thioesterase II family protein n=1 Tax=Streptomyces sp. NPDC001941 TaxID=3154659 RepID=UPI003322FAEC